MTGFAYSPADEKPTIVWEEDSLSRLLADPRKAVPDNNTPRLPGIGDPTGLGDLLAYLEETTK